MRTASRQHRHPPPHSRAYPLSFIVIILLRFPSPPSTSSPLTPSHPSSSVSPPPLSTNCPSAIAQPHLSPDLHGCAVLNLTTIHHSMSTPRACVDTVLLTPQPTHSTPQLHHSLNFTTHPHCVILGLVDSVVPKFHPHPRSESSPWARTGESGPRETSQAGNSPTAIP